MKLVILLSLVCIAAAAPWDLSTEFKYVDNHGRIVEVEYERVPQLSKLPAAATGAGVAAVRAATAVGGLTNQATARFVLDIDDDDYIVRRGGKFGLAGSPLLKASRPDGTNFYVDSSGEALYTLDNKNNIVPLDANHPMLKSAAPGEHPYLLKQSLEIFGGESVELVYSPHTKPQGTASLAGGAFTDAVVIAKK